VACATPASSAKRRVIGEAPPRGADGTAFETKVHRSKIVPYRARARAWDGTLGSLTWELCERCLARKKGEPSGITIYRDEAPEALACHGAEPAPEGYWRNA
jgi:hypothetical protein